MSLQTQILLDANYKAMAAETECYKQNNVTTLLAIIKRMCSGLVVVENPQHSVLESLYSVLLVKGDDYDSLEEYTTVFKQRMEVAEQFGWCFASDKLRDLCVAENLARKDNSAFAAMLTSWQGADHQGHLDNATLEEVCQGKIVAGRKALHEFMKAQTYLRRSGSKYIGLRKELANNYTKETDNYANTMARQRVMIEYYRPIYVPKKESPVTPSNQKNGNFLQKGTQPGGTSDKQNDGGTSAQHLSASEEKECFRCERKGKCSAHDCTETTKEDRSTVNSKELIKEHCVAKQNASRAAYYKKKAVGGSQHFMGSKVVPTFEEVIADKEPYENWYYEGHAFVQENIHVDIRNTGHLFNQKSSNINRFEVLCDNQSTSNVIVTKEFLSNIRPCRWTLCLRTQTGTCKINQIGDLPGVGTVWYYPNGVANIILQHNLITDSKWSINHSSHKFEQSGDVRDLSIDCVTSEGVKVCFIPTVAGLHVMDCSSYFKKGKPMYVFGRKITENRVQGGDAMCNTSSDTISKARELDNLGGIDTVANSKRHFSKRDQVKAKLVRRFQHVSGHPSDETLVYSSITNGIRNSPITKEDVLMTLRQLGKSVYAVQGKNVRHQPDAVNVDEARVELPPKILEYYKKVELSVDVLHVNSIPFLGSISKNIHYVTYNALDSMKIPVMEATIEMIIHSYAVRGFHIALIHVDIQFKVIKDRKCIPTDVNVVARGEHVPEIERMNCVAKEHARCYYAMLAQIDIEVFRV